MSKTDVTLAQVQEIRRLAISKGITKAAFQGALDDGRFSAFVGGLLAPVAQAVKAAREWATWMKVQVGVLTSADEARKALASAGFRIGDWGNDILGKVSFRKEATPEDVEFVRVSVAELGFKKSASRRDIYAKALELGLELCLPEDGPALRLAYKDQPLGEWILVAMEPITDSNRCPRVFYLGRYGVGLWLNALDGIPERHWHAGRVWVFRRKSSALKP